jgi:hypothetical protein
VVDAQDAVALAPLDGSKMSRTLDPASTDV